jgi:hypothetical protein
MSSRCGGRPVIAHRGSTIERQHARTHHSNDSLGLVDRAGRPGLSRAQGLLEGGVQVTDVVPQAVQLADVGLSVDLR